ncbi:hypothetical protein FHU41_002037 [Psychromicrobium silvestre]|uniref:YCII-related domain-containing protein n=1 Tax=Psychromicrobium silvestre TaxID=1645614 RepID=A0A7Y9LUE5_9MICC|nr:YciI family protein [Psychromicrobium silvestre]NYE95787.1 hypothetical protein [Psychromicrobium silvestre]
MAKFLVLYKADQSAAEQMAQASPEEQEAGMQVWMDWAGKAGDAIVDLGSPLAPASAGAESGVGGFSILQADSAEALQGVLEGHPHTAQGGTIEVHEFLQMPGM